jgi:hypothetical protein
LLDGCAVTRDDPIPHEIARARIALTARGFERLRDHRGLRQQRIALETLGVSPLDEARDDHENAGDEEDRAHPQHDGTLQIPEHGLRGGRHFTLPIQTCERGWREW